MTTNGTPTHLERRVIILLTRATPPPPVHGVSGGVYFGGEGVVVGWVGMHCSSPRRGYAVVGSHDAGGWDGSESSGASGAVGVGRELGGECGGWDGGWELVHFGCRTREEWDCSL